MSVTDARQAPRAPVVVEPWDEPNRALVANVHPADWVNPAPAGRYNLVVIGAGTAGLVTAIGAAGLGARVALIERELMGGDCLNVGCVPSKALIRAARAWADVRDAGTFGVEVPPGARVDFPAVMARMRRLRAAISRNDAARRYQDLGVDVFFGAGRFTGPDTVQVADRTLRFKRAVIATGARAAAPAIPGLADTGYLTNETVFTLEALPRRLAVIGAGPIGCELSQAFARFGADVAVLEAGPQILPREDRDATERLERALARDGVRLVLNCTVEQIARRGREKVIRLSWRGQSEMLLVEAILVAVGRAPNVEHLGLETLGVAYDSPRRHPGRRPPPHDQSPDLCRRRRLLGLQVHAPLRFPGPDRYPERALLRPGAGERPDHPLVYVHRSRGCPRRPRPARGRAAGHPDPDVQELADIDRALLDGESEGFVKVHVRAGTDRVVGATIVARHAGEMLPELTLAVAHGVGLGQIARTIHTYPTQAEAIRRMGDAYNRTRLTPRVRWFFERWLRWTC